MNLKTWGYKIMKKVISLLLVTVLAVSLFGCATSGQNNTTKIKETNTTSANESTKNGFEELEKFLQENGETDENGFVNITIPSKSDMKEIIIRLVKEKNRITVSNIQTIYPKIPNFSAYATTISFEKNSEDLTYITQLVISGDDKAPNNMRTITTEGTIKIKDITANTVFDFSMAADNTGVAVGNDYTKAFGNRIHVIIESLYDFYKEKSIGTLSDLHFINYTPLYVTRYIIDDEITIEMMAVTPAPIGIKINKIEINSAGTPEAHIQFTNTGDKTIIALEFNVKCYDAFGDIIKGYGRYDVYGGTYQDQTISPGKTTPSNWYWDMFGFSNTKTIEVAISKYKLEGEEAVEIPYDQQIWIKMN